MKYTNALINIFFITVLTSAISVDAMEHKQPTQHLSSKQRSKLERIAQAFGAYEKEKLRQRAINALQQLIDGTSEKKKRASYEAWHAHISLSQKPATLLPDKFADPCHNAINNIFMLLNRDLEQDETAANAFNFSVIHFALLTHSLVRDRLAKKIKLHRTTQRTVTLLATRNDLISLGEKKALFQLTGDRERLLCSLNPDAQKIAKNFAQYVPVLQQMTERLLES